MLFHTFSSQEERRKFGGSYFIELQYCGLAQGTGIKKIVSAATIEDWKMDSLYIYGDDGNQFVLLYGKIFTGGIYSNKKSGMVDVHGINYYSQEQTCLMMEKIIEMKPSDYQILLKWMEEVKEYIGFYVLGL